MSFEQSLCFHLSPIILFTVCVVSPMILSFIGLCVFRKLIPSHFVNQSHDVTGPFFSTLGTVYGIFLAFIVSTHLAGILEHIDQSGSGGKYLGNLYFATRAIAQPSQDQIRQLLRNYRNSVVTGEWKTMSRGEANPDTEKILEQIGYAYMHCKVAEGFDSSFLNQSIQDLFSMTGLRASRIDDSSSGLLPTLWIVLLLGGMATVGFTFLFGAHNFKAQAVMTMLLTGVICMSIFMIITLDFPFTGAETLSPDSLQRLKME